MNRHQLAELGGWLWPLVIAEVLVVIAVRHTIRRLRAS